MSHITSEDINTELYRLLKKRLGLSKHCLGFTLRAYVGQMPTVTEERLVEYEEADQEIVVETREVSPPEQLTLPFTD